jgi:hypothetical protein
VLKRLISAWNWQFPILARSHAVSRLGDHVRMLFDLRPARLIKETLVSCQREFKASRFGSVKQLAVRQFVPASFECCFYNMMREPVSEWNGSALVEENPHLRSLATRNFGKALLRTFEHCFNLVTFHARKPLEEVLDAGSSFKVFEERSDRHRTTPGRARRR